MKVMIVEDEALLGLGLQEEIIKAGHLVMGPVPSAGEALLLAQSQHPNLALIDLDLKNSSSPARLARVLKDTLGIDSVLMTCELILTDHDTDAALGVIAKPFDLADLPAALDVAAEMLAGGNPPPPYIPSPLTLLNQRRCFASALAVYPTTDCATVLAAVPALHLENARQPVSRLVLRPFSSST